VITGQFSSLSFAVASRLISSGAASYDFTALLSCLTSDTVMADMFVVFATYLLLKDCYGNIVYWSHRNWI